MLPKNYKKEYWYVELESHIMAIHASSGNYKTILITGPHLYLVVTKVNNLTTKLWMDYMNSIIIQYPQFQIPLFKRVTWLLTQKQYRRNFQLELKTKINDLH